MRNRSFSIVLYASVFGISLLLGGCKNSASEIHILFAQSGKPILNPQSGDHVTWPKNQVVFLGATPCAEGKGPLAACTVSLPANQSGAYTYVCLNNACPDPDWEVGPSDPFVVDSLSSMTVLPVLSATATDVDVTLPCDSNAIKPDPATLPDGVIYTSVKVGDVVKWKSNGSGNQYLPNWSIVFDGGNANACSTETTIGWPGTPPTTYQTCTMKQVGAFTYTASTTGPPACSSGTGKITVSP